MRTNIDTNTVISGLLWKGPPHALLTADLIVSGDSDLLELKEYQGIAIVTAAEALTRLPLHP